MVGIIIVVEGFVTYNMHCATQIENIWTSHGYTSNATQTAAVAVNAGVSLEDGNYEANVFSTIGQASIEVRAVLTAVWSITVGIPDVDDTFVSSGSDPKQHN